MTIAYQTFLKLLPEITDDGNRFTAADESVHKFLSSQPIVLLPRGETVDALPLEESEILDLPFKNCFFEYLGGPITQIHNGEEYLNVTGIFIGEGTPREYYTYFLFTSETHSAIHFITDRKIQNHFLGVVRDMLKRFYTEEIGSTTSRTNMKIKLKKGKTQKRIGKIIYVSPPKISGRSYLLSRQRS